MEIAIPLLALGGMYVISNKKSSDEKPEKITHENFNNMGRKPNYMPNVKIPAENYPVLNNIRTRMWQPTNISIRL